ncbi:MAG: hypothetical protein QOI10_1696 [Solirubrobacterales bacterium]|nr:hypothetical protein [Solirubrobacterales bacterium]
MTMSFLRPRTALAIVLAVIGAGAATAFAEVVVYSNDMSTEAKFKEITRSGGGKRCDKKYRAKSAVMLASVKKSPTTCSFRPPVQGDDELANQGVAIDGKILKETPKSMRKGAFIETTVRAGGSNTGYSLRIFPQRQHWELRRGPEGGEFPKHGHSDAIKKINEKNRIEIIATGAQITAEINGQEIVKVSDSNPGQVDGRKVRFSLGSQADKDKGVVGTFKRIAVSVPDP